jgi:hypothetical protein
MEKQIQILKDAIVADYARFTAKFHNAEDQVERFAENITFHEGSKYIRVETEGSVWGFINKGNKKFQVGDLLKAAGRNAPATNKARGNIFETYSVAWTGPHYLANHSGGLASGFSVPTNGGVK